MYLFNTSHYSVTHISHQYWTRTNPTIFITWTISKDFFIHPVDLTFIETHPLIYLLHRLNQFHPLSNYQIELLSCHTFSSTANCQIVLRIDRRITKEKRKTKVDHYPNILITYFLHIEPYLATTSFYPVAWYLLDLKTWTLEEPICLNSTNLQHHSTSRFYTSIRYYII